MAETVSTKTNQYIEYLGDEVHGTAFLSSHTISKSDSVWNRIQVDKPTKDLVWMRDEFGPAIGNKGSRMLLSTEGLSPDLVAGMGKLPGYKVVNE